jgi:hypothetical protein
VQITFRVHLIPIHLNILIEMSITKLCSIPLTALHMHLWSTTYVPEKYRGW